MEAVDEVAAEDEVEGVGGELGLLVRVALVGTEVTHSSPHNLAGEEISGMTDCLSSVSDVNLESGFV